VLQDVMSCRATGKRHPPSAPGGRPPGQASRLVTPDAQVLSQLGELAVAGARRLHARPKGGPMEGGRRTRRCRARLGQVLSRGLPQARGAAEWTACPDAPRISDGRMLPPLPTGLLVLAVLRRRTRGAVADSTGVRPRRRPPRH
jgi:hypothetical protein